MAAPAAGGSRLAETTNRSGLVSGDVCSRAGRFPCGDNGRLAWTRQRSWSQKTSLRPSAMAAASAAMMPAVLGSSTGR